MNTLSARGTFSGARLECLITLILYTNSHSTSIPKFAHQLPQPTPRLPPCPARRAHPLHAPRPRASLRKAPKGRAQLGCRGLRHCPKPRHPSRGPNSESTACEAAPRLASRDRQRPWVFPLTPLRCRPRGLDELRWGEGSLPELTLECFNAAIFKSKSNPITKVSHTLIQLQSAHLIIFDPRVKSSTKSNSITRCSVRLQK